MLKIVVAFETRDPKGYSIEYVEGNDLTMTIDKETHDLTISSGEKFLAIFTSWLWAKAGKE